MSKVSTLTYSWGSTGSKTLILDLDGEIPNDIEVIAGPRTNTTETSGLLSIGTSSVTNTYCVAITPTMSKRFPYSAGAAYLFAVHDATNTKVLSGTLTSVDVDEVVVNVDTNTSGYGIILKARSA